MYVSLHCLYLRPGWQMVHVSIVVPESTGAYNIYTGKRRYLDFGGITNIYPAVFPEMRTALRTYHPVPSLQKTDGNLQDAPRIKNILKSCLLPSELQNTPTTPNEVLNRSVRPSASLFVLVPFVSHGAPSGLVWCRPLLLLI